MALYINGVMVGAENFNINGVTPDNVFANGVKVWEKKAPAGSQTFTSSGTFTVPAGYSQVTICMVGGGGSGASAGVWDGRCGGYAGQVVSQVVSGLTGGQEIAVTVGSGGASVYASLGNAGTASSFGAYVTASGGAGGSFMTYLGNGGGRTTCGGSGVDGSSQYIEDQWGEDWATAYGGQSSGFSNGGNGIGHSAGGAGGVGSGGGASIFSSSGAGGRGEVRVSWS